MDNICEAFRKGKCSNIMCPKYHEYKYCHNYANSLECERGEQCKFLHITIMERMFYERGSNGILRVIGQEAVKRGQMTGAYHEFLTTGSCSKGLYYCPNIHIQTSQHAVHKCPVCHDAYIVDQVSVLDECGHTLCAECSQTLVDQNYRENGVRDLIICPMCRKQGISRRLLID